MTSFIDDIAGLRDLRLNDEPPVPRRARLRIIGPGITLYDDPATEETRLELPQLAPPQLTATAAISGSLDVNFDAGLEASARAFVSLIRLTASEPARLIGMVGDFPPRVVLLNIGDAPITLAHGGGNDTPAASRFLCASSADYTLQGGRALELVRDDVSQAWRTVI